MGTKAIERALEMLDDHSTTDCQPQRAADMVKQALVEAHTELEAIRRAARALSTDADWRDADAAKTLLQAIAKEVS